MDRQVNVSVAGDDDRLCGEGFLADRFQKVQAALAGKADVGDGHLRSLLPQKPFSREAVVGLKKGVAFRAEEALEGASDSLFVVDDQEFHLFVSLNRWCKR